MKAALLLFLFCLAEADDIRYEVNALFEQLKSSLEDRLSSLEGHQKSNLQGQDGDMASRLSASETKIDQLQTRLSESEKLVEELQKQKAAHLAQLSTVQTQVQKLSNKPQVAFSVGLGQSVGPHTYDTTVIYRNVITNIGNAYNPIHGIFTSPVKGVYLFMFTASQHGASKEYLSIHMYKNDKKVMHEVGWNNHGNWASISNGIIIELEERDTVYMRLPAGCRLYATSASNLNQNQWSGVLV